MTVSAWLIDLDRPAGEIAGLSALLDEAERARMACLRAPRDAARYAVRRGTLRMILGEMMGCRPEMIRFGAGGFGKPIVDGGPHFSVSSSGPVALLTVSANAAIGCDIERRDPQLADPAVATRWFAPGERAALAELPPEAWTAGFFNCWTRKEAVVKALGFGLTYPLASFEVTLTPGMPARLISPIEQLQLHAFDLEGALHVAICVASAATVPPPRWRRL